MRKVYFYYTCNYTSFVFHYTKFKYLEIYKIYDKLWNGYGNKGYQERKSSNVISNIKSFYFFVLSAKFN